MVITVVTIRPWLEVAMSGSGKVTAGGGTSVSGLLMSEFTRFTVGSNFLIGRLIALTGGGANSGAKFGLMYLLPILSLPQAIAFFAKAKA